MGKNQIEIGRKYHMGDVECKAVLYDRKKEVLMLREQDGNISFVIGNFVVANNDIVYNNVRTYMVKDSEFIDCIESSMKDTVVDSVENLIEDITQVLHDKYYKIPSYLLEIVAQWYVTNTPKK